MKGVYTMVDTSLDKLYYEGVYEYKLGSELYKRCLPIDEYSLIFEAEDLVIAEKNKRIERAQDRSQSGVSKIISAVKKMITNLIDSIKDFFDRLGLKGDEKARFEAYRKQMAENPALKNKRITVKDFRAVNQQYEALIADVERDMRAERDGEQHPIDAKIHEYEERLKNIGLAQGSIVAADVAIKMAESNVDTAKKIQRGLRSDSKLMEQLSKSLGDKEAGKFKKSIDAAARNSIFTRLKVKIRHQQYEHVEDAFQATITELKNGGFANPFSWLGRNQLNNQYTKGYTRAAIKSGAVGAKNAVVDTVKKKGDDFIHKLFTGKSKTEKKRNQEAEYTPAGDFLFGGFKKRKESQQTPPEPDKDPNK